MSVRDPRTQRHQTNAETKSRLANANICTLSLVVREGTKETWTSRRNNKGKDKKVRSSVKIVQQEKCIKAQKICMVNFVHENAHDPTRTPYDLQVLKRMKKRDVSCKCSCFHGSTSESQQNRPIV